MTHRQQRLGWRVALLMLLLGGVADAQEAAPVVTAQRLALGAASLPQEAVLVDRTLREIRRRASPSAGVEAVLASLEAEEATVLTAAEATRSRLVSPGAAADIRDALSSWAHTGDRLERERREVETYAGRLDADTAVLDALHTRWQAGRAALAADGSATATTRADSVLASIAAARAELVPRSLAALDGVLRLTALHELSLAVHDELDRATRERMFARDSVPLWLVLEHKEGPAAWWPAIEASVQQRWRDVWAYLQREKLSVVLQLLLSLLLAGGFGRVTAPTVAIPSKYTSWRAIVERPLSAGVVLALGGGAVLHARAPSTFLDLLVVVAVVPLWRTLQVLMPGRTARTVFLVFGMYVVNRTVPLLAGAEAGFRLALFVADLLALAMAIWAHRRLVGRTAVDGEPSARPLSWLLRVAAVAFAVALAANVVGFVSLATLIVDGSIAALYLAVVLWMSSLLLEGCTRLAVRSAPAQRLGMFKHHGDYVADWARRAYRLVGVAMWVSYTLKMFSLFDPLWQGSEQLLSSVVTIGSMALSLGSIVAFVLGGWLAVMVARAVRFALDEDVLPRLELPRGMPATISKTTQYAVLAAGFFVALAAAGVRLEQFSFVAGALGLGIGFGLQTTANNFVSGLVMLFERPVRVGDVIEVGPLTGTMQHIGIRASRVRTLDGAEVIVPNGMLMANQVVNWTLTDRLRRFDLPVGVAYSEDPARVVALLEAVALATPGVVSLPAPTVLLEGFGASSLDFVVRSWAPYDEYIAARGALAIRAEAGLREAGITIPFPQRDLHLRTVDAAVISGAAE